MGRGLGRAGLPAPAACLPAREPLRPAAGSGQLRGSSSRRAPTQTLRLLTGSVLCCARCRNRARMRSSWGARPGSPSQPSSAPCPAASTWCCRARPRPPATRTRRPATAAAAARRPRWQVRCRGERSAPAAPGCVRLSAGAGSRHALPCPLACLAHSLAACRSLPAARAEAAKAGRVHVQPSLDAAMQLLSSPELDAQVETVFVIGGGQVGWRDGSWAARQGHGINFWCRSVGAASGRPVQGLGSQRQLPGGSSCGARPAGERSCLQQRPGRCCLGNPSRGGPTARLAEHREAGALPPQAPRCCRCRCGTRGRSNHPPPPPAGVRRVHGVAAAVSGAPDAG